MQTHLLVILLRLMHHRKAAKGLLSSVKSKIGFLEDEGRGFNMGMDLSLQNAKLSVQPAKGGSRTPSGALTFKGGIHT